MSNQASSAVQLLSRIVIVEDNPVDAQIIRYALRGEGDWLYETTLAADGDEAVGYLNKVASGDVSPPDLIILDMTLPKRDGLEVLQIIQSTRALAGLSVVILSSFPESVVREKAMQANVTIPNYLSKPRGMDQFAELGRRLRECCAAQKH